MFCCLDVYMACGSSYLSFNPASWHKQASAVSSSLAVAHQAPRRVAGKRTFAHATPQAGYSSCVSLIAFDFVTGDGMKRKVVPEQVELILRLYELRREPVMREARGFVGGPFLPKSVDEFVSVVTHGGKQGAFVLQVYGYWDMACAFVLHGALSEALVYDTCQEMYFQFAKIHPFLKGFRREMNLPEWMQSLEKVATGSPRGRKRMAIMRANLDLLAQLNADHK
jgi:hypothetical protein